MVDPEYLKRTAESREGYFSRINVMVLPIFRVYTECIQKGVSVNELVTISKKHEKKLVVRFILINSIIALCFLVNPVLQRAGIVRVSVSILLIIMSFLLDYYFLLLSPYKKIIFHDSFYCFHLPQSEA